MILGAKADERLDDEGRRDLQRVGDDLEDSCRPKVGAKAIADCPEQARGFTTARGAPFAFLVRIRAALAAAAAGKPPSQALCERHSDITPCEPLVVQLGVVPTFLKQRRQLAREVLGLALVVHLPQVLGGEIALRAERHDGCDP